MEYFSGETEESTEDIPGKIICRAFLQKSGMCYIIAYLYMYLYISVCSSIHSFAIALENFAHFCTKIPLIKCCTVFSNEFRYIVHIFTVYFHTLNIFLVSSICIISYLIFAILAFLIYYIILYFKKWLWLTMVMLCTN